MNIVNITFTDFNVIVRLILRRFNLQKKVKYKKYGR